MADSRARREEFRQSIGDLRPEETQVIDGYFGISVGPAYCAPYPVYYGGYYPHYYRQYYYYDNPYRYGYWRHHRRWHHDHDD